MLSNGALRMTSTQLIPGDWNLAQCKVRRVPKLDSKNVATTVPFRPDIVMQGHGERANVFFWHS